MHYNHYKELRNQTQSLVRAKKRDYYLTIFSRAKSSDVVWRELRQLELIKVKDGGVRLACPVEELNMFFAGGFECSATGDVTIPGCLENSDDLFSGNFDDSDFHWKYVSSLSISSALSRTKSDAMGVDDIPLRLLKLVGHSVLPILEHLFNYSLMHGVFPSLWILALVCPISKVRNPTTVQHYRPISILPLSKALERVAGEQIREYLGDANLLDPNQSYRQHHSTQTCLRVLDEVRCAADRRMVTVSIFFDFSKAFDRVDHVLLIKLRSLNFSDSTLTCTHT